MVAPLSTARRLVRPLALALLATLLLPPVASAACDVGGVLGSTLLFPYFEVELGDPAGLTTLIALNNEAVTSTMTRVVLWTDWAIPVLAFDVFLAPRDVQTINVRDLLNGVLPATGAGADLSAFSGCGATPPTYPNPAFTATEAEQLRANLSGVPGPLNALCAGESFGDNVARGYITVDTVGSCHARSVASVGSTAVTTPRTTTYFTGTAVVKNFLWGDLIYADPGEDSAQGVEALALVGDAAGFAGPNVNTFYGRYHSFDGRDKRSPLPTTLQTRFINGGAFTGGTDLIVWRDNRSTAVSKVACGGHPSWHPLVAKFITARDEQTNLALSLTDTTEFPLATQRVPVASLGAGPTAFFGRIQVGFFFPGGANAGAWMMPVMTASGRFSVGFDAIPLQSGCGLTP